MKNIKKVIVTGGYGFIGSNLIKYLLKKNYFVINIDKLSYSANLYNLKDIKDKNYVFFKADIGNKILLTKLLKRYNPSIIFNLAAETHVDRSIDSPKNFINSNVFGTFNLLEAFKTFSSKHNSKLVHISTDEVYGDILKGRSDENYSYKPSSPYAASKAASDHLVYSYIRTYKIPAVISNCSNNYGPKQHPEKLIPKLIYSIINNKELPIYGKGKNSREWLHVKDHCMALFKVFEKGKIGEFYNIGSNKNLNNIQITKALIKIAKNFITIGHRVKIKYIADRPGHDQRYALNSNKIKKKLKWKPKIKFDSGLKETFLWYLNNKKYYSSLTKKDIVKRLGLKK
jgi:dTDP-glucose 4,6-dehydratase